MTLRNVAAGPVDRHVQPRAIARAARSCYNSGVKRSVLLLVLLSACARQETVVGPAPAERPSILLVTLDTTRADSIGPEAKGIQTPAFNALAARGMRFRQAYATTPQTLPSHISMFTGLYPGGHGVHENGRYLRADQPLLQERLKEKGYRTAAFVSAFPLSGRFGIARGFDAYDDALSVGSEERSASETTDRALAWLAQQPEQPLFLWVHYFEPHYPYAPPPEFRQQRTAYLGEVAAMDAQLGRLVRAFERRGQTAVIVAGDHGEGLGEHGEAQHGNLLYQGTMHVPLVVRGPGFANGTGDAPVSTRRIFHTILEWAGDRDAHSLRAGATEVVLGEAMIPFLQFGWQPQVMAVEGGRKAIQAGPIEVYEVIADPAETRDLGTEALSREARKSLLSYPIPSPEAPPPSVDDEARRKLASLGYVAAEAKPVVRVDAPRPRDMAFLFEVMDRASVAFARGDYDAALPLLERIIEADPQNLVTILRIAAIHSARGDDERATVAFRRARAMAPDSPDVRHYLALHYARRGEWQKATPLLERVVAESPDRLPAVEALAQAREKQGRAAEAIALWQKVHAVRAGTPAELVHVGALAMASGDTRLAINAFEAARRIQDGAFRHDLELGVLYLAARRLAEARDALDRVPPSHEEYGMALFKRAQVSVLLREKDAPSRIEMARRNATPLTRELIARERLFREP